MRKLAKAVAVIAVVCGITLGIQAVASAQHCAPAGRGYYGGGYQGGGYGVQYRGNLGGISVQYRSNYRPTWHDTSHYDYHPGGYQRHRNHYHYVPGHYDLHRTGHWHH